jgi:hypothetical protein
MNFIEDAQKLYPAAIEFNAAYPRSCDSNRLLQHAVPDVVCRQFVERASDEVGTICVNAHLPSNHNAPSNHLQIFFMLLILPEQTSSNYSADRIEKCSDERLQQRRTEQVLSRREVLKLREAFGKFQETKQNAAAFFRCVVAALRLWQNLQDAPAQTHNTTILCQFDLPVAKLAESAPEFTDPRKSLSLNGSQAPANPISGDGDRLVLQCR